MNSHSNHPSTAGIVAIEHSLFRLLITEILKNDLHLAEVFVANSLDDVIDYSLHAATVSLILLDMNFPGVGDVSNLSIVRSLFPKARVVVSGPSRRADMLHALHAGVHGYISEAMSVQELTPALTSVADGKIFVPDIIADLAPATPKQLFAFTHSRDAGDVSPFSPSGTFSGPILTPRQKDVLRLIVQGQSNKEIARALHLRESTVKVHVATIFRTLGVHNRSGAAGVGVRFIETLASQSQHEQPSSEHLKLAADYQASRKLETD